MSRSAPSVILKNAAPFRHPERRLPESKDLGQRRVSAAGTGFENAQRSFIAVAASRLHSSGCIDLQPAARTAF